MTCFPLPQSVQYIIEPVIHDSAGWLLFCEGFASLCEGFVFCAWSWYFPRWSSQSGSHVGCLHKFRSSNLPRLCFLKAPLFCSKASSMQGWLKLRSIDLVTKLAWDDFWQCTVFCQLSGLFFWMSYKTSYQAITLTTFNLETWLSSISWSLLIGLNRPCVCKSRNTVSVVWAKCSNLGVELRKGDRRTGSIQGK